MLAAAKLIIFTAFSAQVFSAWGMVADATRTFIHSVEIFDCATGLKQTDLAVGVAVNTMVPGTIYSLDIYETGEYDCVTLSLGPSSKDALGQVEYLVSSYSGVNLTKGTVVLREANSTRQLDCVTWGAEPAHAWLNCRTNLGQSGTFGQVHNLKLIDPLNFVGEFRDDYDYAKPIALGGEAVCMSAVPSSTGSAKNAGKNSAVAWVNEVLYNAECADVTGVTGFEVVSLEAGEYHLMIGDAENLAAVTAEPVRFLMLGVKWIEPSMFTPEASGGNFSSGYAILTTAVAPHRILSAVSWGAEDVTPHVDVVLPDKSVFTAVPLRVTTGGRAPLAIEVGGKDMLMMSNGTWSERGDTNCSPGALNDKQTIAESITDGVPTKAPVEETTEAVDESTTITVEVTEADTGGAIGTGLHRGVVAVGVVMTYLCTAELV
eukprot:Selendium_serpulae@DN4486_c0_g2_i1.p1